MSKGDKVKIINRNRIRFGQEGVVVQEVHPVPYVLIKFDDSPDLQRMEIGDYEVNG